MDTSLAHILGVVGEEGNLQVGEGQKVGDDDLREEGDLKGLGDLVEGSGSESLDVEPSVGAGKVLASSGVQGHEGVELKEGV